MFVKEVDSIVKIGLLERVNESEWVSTPFSKPKAKTNQVQFMNNLRHLNRQLKHKTYTMPKIREMLLKLEVFKCAISLYLTMGYYYILMI